MADHKIKLKAGDTITVSPDYSKYELIKPIDDDSSAIPNDVAALIDRRDGIHDISYMLLHETGSLKKPSYDDLVDLLLDVSDVIGKINQFNYELVYSGDPQNENESLIFDNPDKAMMYYLLKRVHNEIFNIAHQEHKKRC